MRLSPNTRAVAARALRQVMSPLLSVSDVGPGNINTVVNFANVFILIKAFQGETYPFGPADPDGNCP